jgi:hypothetical protein
MVELAGRATPLVYETLDPRGRAPKRATIPNPAPLETLDGMRIGELWDYLFKGDIMFPMFREGIRRQYPTATFVEFPVFGNTHGTDEHDVVTKLPELLREHGCDAVISGVGC